MRMLEGCFTQRKKADDVTEYCIVGLQNDMVCERQLMAAGKSMM
jgi:hypothetical protein